MKIQGSPKTQSGMYENFIFYKNVNAKRGEKEVLFGK